MRCVGVALANRINSEVLRSIINYEINKEVNRDEESLEEKNRRDASDFKDRFHKSLIGRSLYTSNFLSAKSFPSSGSVMQNRYDGDLRKIAFKLIRSIRIQLRKYLQSQFAMLS